VQEGRIVAEPLPEIGIQVDAHAGQDRRARPATPLPRPRTLGPPRPAADPGGVAYSVSVPDSNPPPPQPPTGLPDVPPWVAEALGPLPVGVCLAGSDGVVIWANPALADLVGSGIDDLLGKRLTEVVHPADRAAVHDSVASLGQAGDPARRLRARGRPAGTWLDLALTRAPLQGAGTGVLMHVVDVTWAVQAQGSLQVLSDNALDIVAMSDTDGTILWVSPSVRTVLGREPESVVGRSLRSLAAPEDLLGLSDALDGAEPGQGPTTRTVRLRSQSGAYRYMSITARPADDERMGGRIAIAMRDITEELRAKRELARSEEQFRMALIGAPEGMAVTDSQDRIVQVNPALCELLGTTATGLIGHRFREFIPEDEREQVDQWRDRLLRGSVAIERCQHRLASATNEVWVDHSIGIMRDELGNPQLFVHQFADRTAARRLQDDLAYRASHDVQTGLANKESLRTRLAQRLGCMPDAADAVGVLFCDIDNLKPINDRHGHLVGDAVIAAVANRLERAVRRQDLVARVGGDEFVIVLDHCASETELGIVARNVHAAASHPVETAAGTLETTITVGAVLVETTAGTDEALARADAALYRAKRAGRNRISVEGLLTP
jgi:diguanylate cyclase (GGDEF)-like protein/PAS domain S-box-containing protein